MCARVPWRVWRCRWPHRAGPRIFIGKLSKDTTEADVKEYFVRFGYVMDVYLPKAKDNKMVRRAGAMLASTGACAQARRGAAALAGGAVLSGGGRGR